MKKLLLLIPFILLTLACTFSINTFPVSTVSPSATSQFDASSIPPQAPFTFTPESAGSADATVTGRLSFPSEYIPAMRVVLFSLTDGKAYFVDTALNQATYALQVPAGTYYLVSYMHEGTAGERGFAESYTLGGGSYAGGYTQMVPCGLQYGCEDHTLIPVTVEAGETVSIDPGDWYAPEGIFPVMPDP
jgi:hypothetical protein